METSIRTWRKKVFSQNDYDFRSPKFKCDRWKCWKKDREMIFSALPSAAPNIDLNACVHTLIVTLPFLYNNNWNKCVLPYDKWSVYGWMWAQRIHSYTSLAKFSINIASELRWQPGARFRFPIKISAIHRLSSISSPFIKILCLPFGFIQMRSTSPNTGEKKLLQTFSSVISFIIFAHRKCFMAILVAIKKRGNPKGNDQFDRNCCAPNMTVLCGFSSSIRARAWAHRQH